MKKKLFLLFTIMAIGLSNAWAYQFSYTYNGQTLCYNIVNGNAVVTYRYTSSPSYSDLSGMLEIPSSVTYNGTTYSVTSIGNYAFDNCSGLTSVTIPNSVTNIGDHAFAYCRGLTSVTIPNSVTSIGYEAFYNCRGLTRVNYTGTLAQWCNIDFGGYAANPTCNTQGLYIGGTRLEGSLVIPEGVEAIKNYAFRNCQGLSSVTIPNSVTSIGEYAFYDCIRLTSVTIPNSVTSIGSSAFFGCSSLTSVTIPNSVTSIGEYAFYNCIRLTSVTIPNSVITIGGYAFAYCSGLTSVTIPNSVTSIGASAFAGCSRLTSVTIPNSVTSIGSSAFSNCSDLTSVTIPNSVTSIGDRAFQYCSSLTSVTIGNSVTTIGEGAFYNCSGLTSVTIPNSVTTIEGYAFYDCGNLTRVSIPNSVTTIGSSAFSGRTQLATVYDYSNLPITRGSSDFGGVARNATKVVKVLTDDRGNFKAESQYSVDSIYYTRSYEQGNRSTLCLPFKPAAVSPSGSMKYYEAGSFDGSTITFNEVAFENLEANKPYMVEWPASKTPQEFKFSAGTTTIIESRTADTTVDLGNNGSFIGTMTRECMTSSNYGYKNGYFVQSADGTQEEPADHAHVNPFRAYFEITTPSGSQGFAMPTELSVRFNTAEDNVGIDSVEPQQSNIRYSNDVYDMMGRMVRKNAESLDGLRKGVYIWKGEKKVVF